ncbi:hypothetical protein OTU49_008274, partial [Cherax quadricarinatus]
AYLTNLSQVNPTLLNGSPMATQEINILEHKDIITVHEREFRWEYPEDSSLVHSQVKDHLTGYKILSPTTKSPISRHNLSGECTGLKRRSCEEDFQECSDAKRKKVSFGPHLHPEHFDKLLPPDTPVSKGEKPNTRILLDTSDSSRTVARKSKRVSVPPLNISSAEECGMDTPTKSLLRRRSPTPVKPYIARSLGLLVSKAMNDESSNLPDSKDDSPKQKVSPNPKMLKSPAIDSRPGIDTSPKRSTEKSSSTSPKLTSPKVHQTSVNSTRNSLTSTAKVISHDLSPKTLKMSSEQSSECEIIYKLENLTTPKGSMRNSLRKLGAFSSPRRVTSESPRATPKRSESPRATPKRSESPRATPK